VPSPFARDTEGELLGFWMKSQRIYSKIVIRYNFTEHSMGIFFTSSRYVLFTTADKEMHDIFLSKKVENGNFPLFSPKISGKLRVKSSG